MIKKWVSFGLLSLAALLGVSVNSLHAGAILFDPDGGGGAASVSMDQFDYSVGNALAVNGNQAVRDFLTSGTRTPIQLFFQSTLDNVKLNGIAQASFSGQFTVVGALTEEVDSAFAGGGLGIATFRDAAVQTVNYFEIWYNPTVTVSNLGGTGFNTGTKILSGNVSTSGDTSQNNFITNQAVAPQAMDQFGVNDYPLQTTQSGSGGSTLKLNVSTLAWDPLFFPFLESFQVFNFTTQLTLPFITVDPSARFLTTSTTTAMGIAPTLAGAGAPATLGVNGSLTLGGNDFQVQTDASSAVSGTVVPEPTSLAIFGLLAGCAAIRVRRRK